MIKDELDKINEIINQCPRPDLIKMVDMDNYVSLQLIYKIKEDKEEASE